MAGIGLQCHSCGLIAGVLQRYHHISIWFLQCRGGHVVNVELSIIVRSGYKSQFHLIRLGGGLERYLKGQWLIC